MKDDTADVPIENLSLTALKARQDDTELALIQAKVAAGEVKAEISRRLGESVKRFISDAGKTHGTASLPMQDGLVAKGEMKQTVNWDSAALQAVAQTLPWDRVIALFKIDFSMSETIYKGVAAVAPELREKIDAARTTIVSEPSVKLVAAG